MWSITPQMQENKKFRFENIFHPSDFSEASSSAFAHALRLAMSSKSKLSILHVSPEKNSQDWQSFPGVRKTLEAWHALRPASDRMAVNNLGIDVVKIVAEHSNPLTAVLNYLGKHQADLIVLATHQRSGLDRLLHESIAEPIARKSKQMTLFIPNTGQGFISMQDGSVNLKKILLPVTSEPNPQLAIEAAAFLALNFAIENCEFFPLYVGNKSSFPKITEIQYKDWKWQAINRSGNIKEAILETYNEIKPDLVVMTTKGHQGFLDALRGSTSEQILRGIACPLLAIHE